MNFPSKVYLLLSLVCLTPNLMWASEEQSFEEDEEVHDKKPAPKLELNEDAQGALEAAVQYHGKTSWETFSPLLVNVVQIPEKYREFSYAFAQFGIRSLEEREVKPLDETQKGAFSTFKIKHKETIEELDTRAVMTYCHLAKGMDEKARELGKSPNSPFCQARFLTVFRLIDEAKKAFHFAYDHEEFKEDGDLFRLKCALLLPLCGELVKNAYRKAEPLLVDTQPYFVKIENEEDLELAKTLLHAATRTFCDLEPTLLIRACLATTNFYETHNLIMDVIEKFGTAKEPSKALLGEIGLASNGLIDAWMPDYPIKELKALTVALETIDIKPDIIK